MYAIVDIAGQQFKVEKNQEIFVHRLEGKEGSKVKFDDVMLLDDNGKVKIGQPFVKGAIISAKIISHDKGDKITVFHKKRRKGYQKENGHRQLFSKIQIQGIAEKEAVKAAVKKEEPKKVVEKPVAEKKEAVKKTAPKKVAAPKAKKETTAKAKAPAKKTEKE
ncbi:MAG: 50S ribosomal protein L21 [Bacteroidetes bacterium]|nr:50S ribosomal protein L21 [Bacteroidota bacterium]